MSSGTRVYCFDLNGTLCTNANGAYADAEPSPDRIAAVNALLRSGHYVRIFTARGSTTGVDWRELTEHQRSKLGLQHNEFVLGKPYADLYVDDRAVDPEEFDWMT